MSKQKIEEIQSYVLSIDFTKLSIEELKIYIEILVSFENRKMFDSMINSNDMLNFFKK